MGRLLALTLLLLTMPGSAALAAEEILYVRWAGVVLRAEPSLGARTLGGAVPARSSAVFLGARSDVEEIEGATGRWAKVRVGEREGWVFDRNLSFVKPPTPEETRRKLLAQPVTCGRAMLKLREQGDGTALTEDRPGSPEPKVLNVRWWGDGPFYVVFESWRARAGALAQEGLTLCELDYVEARERFDGREVDLRRRAPDTMVPLGLASECRAASGDAKACPPLVVAVVQGRADEVAALLGRGADPNATTRWGWTALHHAAWSGQAALAKSLLKGGARSGAKGRDGCSPLHLAAGAGHAEIASLLLEAKADPQDLDRAGRAPLHWAADEGRTEAVGALLKHGAPADQRDFHGWTALAYAARKGHGAAMVALLQGRASANARDRDDATALHSAAANCRAEAIRILLGHGADGALRDRFGLQPLHHAYFARCEPVPEGLARPPR